MNERDRRRAIELFRHNRDRSTRMFRAITPDAYYEQPIPLRQPIVFYDGHFSAFNFIVLVRRALDGSAFNANLDDLFERGIDPETVQEAEDAGAAWPEREVVREYTEIADRRVLEALEEAALTDDSNPLLVRAQAVHTILEHELMHHETLAYMYHRLPFHQKIRPDGYEPVTAGNLNETRMVRVPAGSATLGAARNEIPFGWDNEFEKVEVDVPGFRVARDSVTNAEFLDFVEAGGYDDPSLWRPEDFEAIREDGVRHPPFWADRDGTWHWVGMYDSIPLPERWPAWVTWAEASAYAKWKGKRLMSEAEYHRAAFGTPSGHERSFPWGEEPPDSTRGNFGGERYEPVPVGSSPAGQSAWGVHDLVGNGWEWTATEFAPLDNFAEMASYPPYSSDFFDGKHFVMKGASPATSVHLISRTFRNWFRPSYPYMYAKFRLAE
jgi:ergothioneine biosynthesis protein EgtB